MFNGLRITQDRIYWLVQGNTVVDRSRERIPGSSFSVNLWTASTAFVGDSSVYGFISPVRGTRYRYEVEALSGDRKRQHSIRINDQWRVCFAWNKGDAYDVEIVDYH